MDEKKIREAIDALSDLIGLMPAIDKSAIVHLKTAIEALEKQLPKKPKEMKYKPLRDFGWKYECPTCRGACGENVYHYDITKDEMYCTTCGQRLDWSR